jgi:hypothetical protein
VGQAIYASWDDNLPTIGTIRNQRENQGANVSFTYTLKANVVNEICWGIAYNDHPRNGARDGTTNVKELGLVGLVPDRPPVAGMLNVSWTGIGLQALTQ